MTTGQPAIARVTREFAASPERVFDAWLDPEKVKIWWRATAAAAGRGATETIESVTIEPRVGGRFSILVRRDGKLLDHTGAYLEIDRPRRLAFTWSALDVNESGKRADDASQQSRVIIEIVPTPTGCDVTLSHEMHPEWRDFVERAAQAWSLMLEAIDEMLAEVPSA
jgi:uncharacterized protein YndB with AHSA1/START domain